MGTSSISSLAFVSAAIVSSSRSSGRSGGSPGSSSNSGSMYTRSGTSAGSGGNGGGSGLEGNTSGGAGILGGSGTPGGSGMGGGDGGALGEGGESTHSSCTPSGSSAHWQWRCSFMRSCPNHGESSPGEGCKVTLDASFDVPVDVTNQVGVTLEEGTVVLVVPLQPGVAEAHAAVALAHLVPVGAPPPVQIFIPGWLGPDFLGTLATRGPTAPSGTWRSMLSSQPRM